MHASIAKYGIDIQIVRPEMTIFKMFREKFFILWELHSKILVTRNGAAAEIFALACRASDACIYQ
jgi:hypothetical protein